MMAQGSHTGVMGEGSPVQWLKGWTEYG